MAYSVGLLGFILVKILVPAFSARKDTKTPVRFGIYAMIANMIFNLALVFPFAHVGLALATSLGAFFNASLLLKRLLKDKIYQPASGWWLFLTRIILANAAMGFGLYYFVEHQLWYDWQALDKVMYLAVAIVLAALVYALTLLLIGFRPRHLSPIFAIVEKTSTKEKKHKKPNKRAQLKAKRRRGRK